MTQETIFTALNIAQFILAILAIGLSLAFFIYAKNAEKQAAISLEAIKTQTEMLKDITAKQMSRLIKNVTEKNPIDDMLTLILTVKDLPQNTQQIQLKDQQIEQLTTEAIAGYMVAYYYSAVVNCFVALHLPSIDNYDENREFDVMLKTIIDLSARDFHNIRTILSRVHPTRIETNSNKSYYASANARWAEYVKDTASHFVDKNRVQ